VSGYDLRQASYIVVFFLLGDSPASEFCADVSEHSVPSSFESNLYLYIHPSNLVPVILLVHTTYEDGTECSETSAHKFRRRRITQKKEYNIHNTVKA